MGMLDKIRAKREEIYAIARRHGADKLSFKFAVADILGCRTDVVSITQLLGCPRFARQVLKERVPV